MADTVANTVRGAVGDAIDSAIRTIREVGQTSVKTRNESGKVKNVDDRWSDHDVAFSKGSSQFNALRQRNLLPLFLEILDDNVVPKDHTNSAPITGKELARWIYEKNAELLKTGNYPQYRNADERSYQRQSKVRAHDATRLHITRNEGNSDTLSREARDYNKFRAICFYVGADIDTMYDPGDAIKDANVKQTVRAIFDHLTEPYKTITKIGTDSPKERNVKVYRMSLDPGLVAKLKNTIGSWEKATDTTKIGEITKKVNDLIKVTPTITTDGKESVGRRLELEVETEYFYLRALCYRLFGDNTNKETDGVFSACPKSSEFIAKLTAHDINAQGVALIYNLLKRRFIPPHGGTKVAASKFSYADTSVQQGQKKQHGSQPTTSPIRQVMLDYIEWARDQNVSNPFGLAELMKKFGTDGKSHNRGTHKQYDLLIDACVIAAKQLKERHGVSAPVFSSVRAGTRGANSIKSPTKEEIEAVKIWFTGTFIPAWNKIVLARHKYKDKATMNPAAVAAMLIAEVLDRVPFMYDPSGSLRERLIYMYRLDEHAGQYVSAASIASIGGDTFYNLINNVKRAKLADQKKLASNMPKVRNPIHRGLDALVLPSVYKRKKKNDATEQEEETDKNTVEVLSGKGKGKGKGKGTSTAAAAPEDTRLSRITRLYDRFRADYVKQNYHKYSKLPNVPENSLGIVNVSVPTLTLVYLTYIWTKYKTVSDITVGAKSDYEFFLNYLKDIDVKLMDKTRSRLVTLGQTYIKRIDKPIDIPDPIETIDDLFEARDNLMDGIMIINDSDAKLDYPRNGVASLAFVTYYNKNIATKYLEYNLANQMSDEDE